MTRRLLCNVCGRRADASTDALISRSSFDDLSGGALKIGNVNDTRAVSNQTSDFDARYTVEDNFLSNLGLEYRGAAAVFAGCVFIERDIYFGSKLVYRSLYDGRVQY